jgi:hypothetical protein
VVCWRLEPAGGWHNAGSDEEPHRSTTISSFFSSTIIFLLLTTEATHARTHAAQIDNGSRLRNLAATT